MPKPGSAFMLPSYKVPIANPDVSNGLEDPWPAYTWTGNVLSEPFQTPIVGAWGMFDLMNVGFGSYPKPGTIRNLNFGRKRTLTHRPRIFVFRFVGSGEFSLNEKLVSDLIGANVDIHGCALQDIDTTLGWNWTQPGIIGTCIPIRERVQINNTASGEDLIIVNGYNAGGVIGSGVPGYPDPAVTNPGYYHYSYAIDSVDTNSYWAGTTHDEPFGYDPDASIIFNPSSTEGAVASIVHPEEFIGGDMLVFDSISPYINIMGSNAYTAVQQNAIMGVTYTQHTPHSNTGYAPLLTLTGWNLNCIRQSPLFEMDRAVLEGAVPRFDKVHWHVFQADIESTNYNTLKEYLDTGQVRNAGREEIQREAAQANIRAACNHPNITLHEVGGKGDIPLDLGESLIREFFNIPE